jgi:hypothetical protein
VLRLVLVATTHTLVIVPVFNSVLMDTLQIIQPDHVFNNVEVLVFNMQMILHILVLITALTYNMLINQSVFTMELAFYSVHLATSLIQLP